ncbi:MAG TPA: hypothetical protein DEP48_01475 [Persephonella sp.]|uniref:Calcium-binding protein n=1 Tax=Persephonella marina (strain DSM 14350 / EX-H1) TaxID=123214 RepID=C0QRG5_PERMH|nr:MULTISPECIES: hypothetical protein [Persephonella]ACO03055.1 calcium-binding protein [Persephonella marina EX-H1]HCB69007.1 hypothetical protein [Persephonella sp.]
MRKEFKKKAILGGSLSLSALLFACGGAGDVASDSPYATVTGTVTSASSTGSLSTTGIDIGNVNLSFIAAVAIDNGKLVYTADDIDNNGNFNLKLKEGLDYAFILFDISKKPKLIVKDSNGNAIKINGDGSVNISLSDSDGDGIPDTASVNITGSVSLTKDSQLDDNDNDHYPDGIENINAGGSVNPDYDEDGDGIFDGIEDKDGDGYIDGHEDSNSNGIPDVYEDDDKDGLPNYLDDSDGDGYPDHIDEDDSDGYKYEMKGTVSNIDTTTGTFVFTYNGTDYNVSVTDTTVCEINDTYYKGADCLSHLTDGAYIELKTNDDISTATDISAVKFEMEDEGYEDHSSDSYRFEIYGKTKNIDLTNGTFVFDWNGTEITVSVDTNIKCEINDVYYYGTDCLNNLADNLCIELKTSDDVYNYDGSAPITAVEFETSDDCGTSY